MGERRGQSAEHFSQIRASRKNNINSTLAFGQLVANTPGQTTIQVRVPYRVVGLVVGPKGATIKRIQQQTHTYIVTPSRDKEPVFEVTGLPENVETAKKEIEAHIELRTGGVLDGQEQPGSGDFNSAFTNGSRSGLGSGLSSLISDSSMPTNSNAKKSAQRIQHKQYSFWHQSTLIFPQRSLRPWTRLKLFPDQ